MADSLSGSTVHFNGEEHPRPLEEVFQVADYSDIRLRGFKCPECGGGYFGTEGRLPGKPASSNRYCNDQFGVGCKWRGPIADALDPNEDLTVHPVLRGLFGSGT